jgi:repressor LexA
MGFRSVNAAEQHLRALEKKGVIEILSGASRGIRVKDTKIGARGARLLELPVIGRVAAGSPILAEAHVQARYQVDPNMFTPRADYLLKVRGLSMQDVGILDGDLLAVHRTEEARTGQIIVARLGEEVTVKRLRRRGNTIQLVAENPDFLPIDIDLKTEDFSIEGIAVGVIRNTRTF